MAARRRLNIVAATTAAGSDCAAAAAAGGGAGIFSSARAQGRVCHGGLSGGLAVQPAQRERENGRAVPFAEIDDDGARRAALSALATASEN